MKKQIFFIFFLFFIGQKSFSTECIKLFNPFKSGLKNAGLVVYGEIIGIDKGGNALLKINERYYGKCNDTIKCFESYNNFKIGDNIILILSKEISSVTMIYNVPECVQSSLIVNQVDNSVTGNITYFNAMICRLSAFFKIYKYPKNHMSYTRLKKIVIRKTTSP
jgi:hypothetical protein